MHTPEYKRLVLDRLSTGWHDDDIDADAARAPGGVGGQSSLRERQKQTHKRVRRISVLLNVSAAVLAGAAVFGVSLYVPYGLAWRAGLALGMAALVFLVASLTERAP